MRSFLQTLLAIVTLGMITPGCGRTDKAPAEATAMDVTLLVPAMN
jgi:hypothetical protein